MANLKHPVSCATSYISWSICDIKSTWRKCPDVNLRQDLKSTFVDRRQLDDLRTWEGMKDWEDDDTVSYWWYCCASSRDNRNSSFPWPLVQGYDWECPLQNVIIGNMTDGRDDIKYAVEVTEETLKKAAENIRCREKVQDRG